MEKMERLAAKDYQSIGYLSVAQPELKVHSERKTGLESKSRTAAKILNLNAGSSAGEALQNPKGEIRMLTVPAPRKGISGLL